jgi:hypothetical protein
MKIEIDARKKEQQVTYLLGTYLVTIPIKGEDKA